ncbi:hypothetical protein EDE12_12049 [Methylosinus sp. sav-2]|nr:hypothetical protein EDE12_12049 [Methylosinus sp. sav-2]
MSSHPLRTLRQCLPIAALAAATSLSAIAQSQSPPYAAPEYVEALIAGNTARLATRDARDWVAEPVMAARESGMPLSTAESAYRRRLVFRSHYIFAFAARFSAGCATLPNEMGAEAASALAAAKTALGQKIEPDGPRLQRTIEDGEGARVLAGWIEAGSNDAAAFLKNNACAASVSRAVASTLTALLSAPAGSVEPNEDMIVRERRAMTGLPDDWFLMDGLYRRDSVEGNPYHGVSRAAAEVATWHIPRPEDEIPGKMVGWRSDMSALAAGERDGKPVLLVLSSPSISCSECRSAIRDILTSGPLNQLAGQFHAMMVVLDGIPESPSSPLRSRLRVKSNIAAILVRLGDKDRKARELLRQEGRIDIRALARDLQRRLPSTHGTGADIEPTARSPSFCWLIEDFELCQARIQRAGPAE